MMALTHMAFNVAVTSIALGTGNLEVLTIAAIASQLPDIDTSKSYIGRIFFPISNYLEKRFAHRSISHSLLATGIITLITSPLTFFIDSIYWQALVLGYFLGWFADAFTKSGVAAFYPGKARLVIPGNPRLRLSTGSSIEWFVLFLLVAIAIISIDINLNGGIIRAFNETLAIPSGAVEIINQESSNYLLEAQITGRNSITSQKIQANYTVIKTISANDILVKDDREIFYRVGRTQDCQIIATQIRIKRIAPISIKTIAIDLEDEDIYSAIDRITKYPRVYLNGTLIVEDAEDLTIPSYVDRFNNITLQPGKSIAFVRLIEATPQQVFNYLEDYYATGNLIARTIEVVSSK
ncbi:MAG: metal-dependent hydrolase [Prochloraceae cyanobacterium]